METTLMNVSSIETPRLLLRLPETQDAAPFLEIHQDPDAVAQKQVVLLSPLGGMDTAFRNLERMLNHWALRGYGQWAVVEKATGRAIGCVGLHYAEGWPGIDLSWIVHRSRRRNGFATEASRAAVAWAWTTTKVDHIVSLISPENVPSLHIARRLGLQFERADVHPIGGDHVHIYGIRRPVG